MTQKTPNRKVPPNRNRSGTGSRKPVPKSTNQKAKATQRDEHTLKLVYEIIAITFVAFAIFLIISIYFNGGGIIGKFFRDLIFGLLGISAYLVPIYLLLGAFLKVFNRHNYRLNHKLSLLFIWMLSFSVFIHIILISGAQINVKVMGKNAFFPTLVNYYSVATKNHTGGGFVGGLVGDVFVMLLGKTGGLLVLPLILLSIIILLTEQSFVSLIKWIGKHLHGATKKVYITGKSAIDDHNIKREQQKIEKDNSEDLFVKHIEMQETNAKERESYRNKSALTEKDGVTPIKSETVSTEFEENKKDPIVTKNPVQISFFKDQEKAKKTKLESESETDTLNIPDPTDFPINKSLYEFPPIEFLKDNPSAGFRGSRELLQKNADKLEQTLLSFGVRATVENISHGPTVTRYELQPDQGVKVSKIVNLSDDIALNLAASGIRIEAPIPGKSLIGIEIPNKEVSPVFLKEVLDTDEFKKFPSKIAFAVGKDISGETIIADIARMPHLLICGSTGSGKSVCINTLITSILYKASPNDVKLLMIDPKVVELKMYDGIPHLLIPVVTETKKAAHALYWAVQEMSDRYKLFANANVRDLSGFNRMVEEKGELKKLPQIVIIVDELADLMMEAAKEVEDAICRLAQMARAAGIHLILATQRPSVDVITGIIKANIPSRIAFQVASGVDSRTILDMNGAEKLIGKGDMLYYPSGFPKPIRVQGSYVSDSEVEKIVEFLKASHKANYNKSILDQISKNTKEDSKSNEKESKSEFDENFDEALLMVVDLQKASASMLQRRFRLGYNRAARIIDQLHEAGYIGPDEGSKPRKVLLTKEEFYLRKKDNEQVMETISVTQTEGIEDFED